MSLIGNLWRRLRGHSDSTTDSGEPHRTDWGAMADASDARAKHFGIDPPRPGRKTYRERYNETSAISTADIKASIAARQAAGKECGVLYRVLADRGED